MDYTSRYNFIEFQRGFMIDGGVGRCPVYVQLGDDNISLEVHHYHSLTSEWAVNGKAHVKVKVRDEPAIYPLGFPEFYRMNELISKAIMRRWVEKNQYSRYNQKDGALTNWGREQTRKAITPRLKEQWLRLKGMVDPEVIKTQNMLYSVKLDVPGWALEEPDFYEDKYTISDILKYRGARALAYYIEEAVQSFRRRQREDMDFTFPYYEDKYATSPYKLIKDWMRFYSPDFETYPALRKTLMNLNGNFPGGPLQNLRYARLPQAIKERNKLLAICVLAGESQIAMVDGERSEALFDIVLRSKDEDFIKAYELVEKEHNWWGGGKRTYKYARQAIRYMLDFPDIHNGYKIRGLARRAVEYHKDEDRRQMMPKDVDAKTETELPPISLPENKHIRFLTSVEEVVNEGVEMHHCVGGYAKSATRGQVYLFHVEYRGNVATTSVRTRGGVDMSFGPHNSINTASKYGERMLNEWSSAFPKFDPTKIGDMTATLRGTYTILGEGADNAGEQVRQLVDAADDLEINWNEIPF